MLQVVRAALAVWFVQSSQTVACTGWMCGFGLCALTFCLGVGSFDSLVAYLISDLTTCQMVNGFDLIP